MNRSQIGRRHSEIWAFSSYIAIVAETHPVRVKDMCAYMRLIVQEAQKYGGNSWLTYDSIFRRPVQQPGGTNWTLHCTLHTSLSVPTAASSLRASSAMKLTTDRRTAPWLLCHQTTIVGSSLAGVAASAWEATGTRYSVQLPRVQPHGHLQLLEWRKVHFPRHL